MIRRCSPGEDLTRPAAIAVLAQLAAGLPCDAGGAARLLERVSTADDPEGLRAALVDLGAEAVLDRRSEPTE